MSRQSEPVHQPYPFLLLLNCIDAAFANNTGNLAASVSDFLRWTLMDDGPTSKAPPSRLRNRRQEIQRYLLDRRQDPDRRYRHGWQEHAGRLDARRGPCKASTPGPCEGRQGVTPESFPPETDKTAMPAQSGVAVFWCAQEIRHQFSRIRIRRFRSSSAGSDRQLPETPSRQAGVRKAHVQRGSNPRTKTMAGPHPSRRHQCRNASPTGDVALRSGGLPI